LKRWKATKSGKKRKALKRRQKLRKTKGLSKRFCEVCGEAPGRDHLAKFVKGPDGEIAVDLRDKINGDAFYLCLKQECFKGVESKPELNIDSALLAEKLKEAAFRGFISILITSIGANKLIEGTVNVEKIMRKGKVNLLLIPEDASASSIEKVLYMAEKNGIRKIELPGKEVMADLLNRPVRAVFALNDEKISNAALRFYELEKMAAKMVLNGV